MSNAQSLGLLPVPQGVSVTEGSIGGINPANMHGLQQQQVSAMKTLTAPMPTTEVLEYRYYKCAVVDAGIHRTDGKKLSFISGNLRTNILEDIVFLDNEIRGQHPLIAYANPVEIEEMKAFFNPRAAQTERVLKEQFGGATTPAEVEAAIRAKVRAELEAELQAQVAAAMQAGAGGTGALGGADISKLPSGELVSGSVAAVDSNQALLTQGRALIKPQNSSQIAAAAAPAAKL